MEDLDVGELPALLYVGDVPVEASTGGALLLHRLLGEYPASKLRIAELEPWTSRPERRISSVSYDAIPFGVERLVHSRLAPWYSTWLHEKAPFAARTVEERTADFEPEAILTVVHWHAYRTAAAIADRNGLPLYVMVHDDMRAVHPIWEACRSRLDHTMGKVYRQAASRLCVSPYMAEAYEDEWGVGGDVLYPHRGAEAPRWMSPPESLGAQSEMTVGYAGSFGTAGARLLRSIADELKGQAVRFVVYSTYGADRARRQGMDHPRIEYRSPVPPSDVIPTLRSEADALLALMRFQSQNERIARYSFPSKLTDYTATGLPIVLWGPDYWSAIRWARDHDPVAVTVTEREPSAVARALERLADDAEHRWRLAERSLEVGQQYFSHEQAVRSFFDTLVSGATRPTSE